MLMNYNYLRPHLQNLSCNMLLLFLTTRLSGGYGVGSIPTHIHALVNEHMHMSERRSCALSYTSMRVAGFHGDLLKWLSMVTVCEHCSKVVCENVSRCVCSNDIM